jgi:ferredoxin
MRVVVDDNRCQGHARCFQLASNVFGLDEVGHSVALLSEIPIEYAELARRAVDNCPELALAIEDGEDS